MLMAFTYLPGFVTLELRGMPTVWRSRHRLILCWRSFLQAVSPGRKTLEEMARWTPATITAWRFGRLLKAPSGNIQLIVSGWAPALLAILPPPTHGGLYLWGDGRHADKRGSKKPVAQQGRTNQPHPGFGGLRFVLVMAAWEGQRVPGGLRLIVPKCHAAYRRATALWRALGAAFVPPSWAPLVVVGGEAASGAQANLRMVQDRDKAEAAWRWGFVLALARPWKIVEAKALKHLVPHRPLKYDQRPQVPRAQVGTLWTQSTRLGLRHVGEVTVVLSKRGRNVGPQQTKSVGINRAVWTPSQVVGMY